MASSVFLVLFKRGGHRMNLFPILIKGMRRWSKFKIFMRGPRDGKIFLRYSRAVKK